MLVSHGLQRFLLRLALSCADRVTRLDQTLNRLRRMMCPKGATRETPLKV